MTLTPETESHFDCCRDSRSDPNCFPIHLPNNDAFYSACDIRKTCFNFTRSQPYCLSQGGPRRQFNDITAFIDGSNLYGSGEEKADLLRSHQDGLMKYRLVGDQEKAMLPLIINGEETAGKMSEKNLFWRNIFYWKV